MELTILLFKLLATPAIIGLAGLAGRRWGSGVTGWIAGIPLTSGPLALYFALEHGSSFAAAAASATLIELVAVVAFCVCYGTVAGRLSWPLTLSVALLALLIVSVVLHALVVTPIAAFIVDLMLVVVALRLLPSRRGLRRPPTFAGWELLFRMVLATALVLALSGLASLLGPRLSGLLSPVPIYAGLLTVFAHRGEGVDAGVAVLRGVMFGLFGFASFFLCLALMLGNFTQFASFVAATAICLAVQLTALRFVPR